MKLGHFFIAFLLFFCLGLAGISGVHAELTKGRDYAVLLSPQPTRSGNNIEVLEFFWYGCPHCYKLHPQIKDWLKKIPKDVSFRYVPAIFRNSWVPGAKTFYALEVLGRRDELHNKIYEAIHIDKIDLTKEELLFNWVAKQGVEREKFISIYNSFSVENQSSQSSQMSRKYGLEGVPSLVVDGKYLVSGRMGGTPQETIRTLDQLINKVRKERTEK
ncbi:MAG: thiol:disulfide interchange protein DsbA/DsbL [Nitrosomonadales bacterium]|jgi:thiol:disulfide interchange protein DsbA|nr:MAG: thiol:disulfide interchange protein DsbA/DsbL [Nitrosomonadales bacterium]